MNKTIAVLGIRGVPAAHGGFETFAERLALYLVDKGWQVTVYCHENGAGEAWEDHWNGVKRVNIPVQRSGPAGTIIFDLKSTLDARRRGIPCLTLGYNTAVFALLLRSKKIPNVINMDGIEWARAKWGPAARIWFWMNDWLGCWLGNHLVADHPEIAKHLQSRVSKAKITTIPYGAQRILDSPEAPVRAMGLEPGKFLTVVARAEPENSILEIVQGFSRSLRGIKLVVLGNYEASHGYQRKVLHAASEEVLFPGAIYDKEIVHALRYHCLGYVHGHQVGGTNPSLVEALGAGNAVIAHDNKYNRWVAGRTSLYFNGAADFEARLLELLGSEDLAAMMRKGSVARFEDGLKWDNVLAAYEDLLSRHQQS